MYHYNILENGFIIGSKKGKRNAVEFVIAILNRNDVPGIWTGLKCQTPDHQYSIERS